VTVPGRPNEVVIPARDAGSVRLSADVRSAVQELLRGGYLEESVKADVFRHIIVHQRQIIDVLDPLDLTLKLDTVRGIAVICVRQEDSRESDSAVDLNDEWTHPLVRRQRMTLEQSLLVAILRQTFVLHEQEMGIGGSQSAKIAIDDLLPQYLTYVEDSGSDARNETRLTQLLEQLKGYGIVSGIDANQEVIISPLIAYLADPASLTALLRTMQEHTEGSPEIA
jgi:Cdc6-like AAA superfamily ATPase